MTIDEFHKYSSSEPALEDLLTGVRKFKVGLTMAHQTTASISSRLCSTILGTVGTVACFRISAEEAHHIARELQLVERRANGQGEEIAAIEEAIGHERQRLRQLQAADSSVLHALYADLQRARRTLLVAGHDEPTVRLRTDLLQTLEQGHQLVFGLPPFQQVVSLQAPAEAPGLSAPYQGGPAELIARSKELHGIKRPEALPISPDELGEEDYWVTR